MSLFVTSESLSLICSSQFPARVDKRIRRLLNTVESADPTDPGNRRRVMAIHALLMPVDQEWDEAANADLAAGRPYLSEGSLTGGLIVYPDGLPFSDAEIAEHLEQYHVPEVLQAREATRRLLRDYPMPSERFWYAVDMLRDARASYSRRMEEKRTQFMNRMANSGKRGLFVACGTWEEAERGGFADRKSLCRLFREDILASMARTVDIDL